jgi:pimeloyl-ACP methyl ester carboxylesterase
MSSARPQRDANYGHGAKSLRGRSASGPPGADPNDPPLEVAMRNLLRLAGGDIKSTRAIVGGRTLHYLEAGSGPPIVLLQGASGGGANWFRLIRPLAEHFRVLAPDVPGFALSDAIEPEAPLSRGISEALQDWLEVLAIRPHALIGTSYGGLLAVRLVQQGVRADRLVLIDSAGLGQDLPALVRISALPGIGRLALRPSRLGTRWLLKHLMTRDLSGMPPAELDVLVEFLWRSAAAADVSMMARAMQLFADARGQREVLSDPELAGMRIPTLMVWGERDQFFPSRHAHSAAARMPDGRVHVLPGIGHSPNWEAPEAVLRAVLPFLLAATPPAP